MEGWKSLVHVLEFPYRMIGGKHERCHVFSRLVEVGVYMPQGRYDLSDFKWSFSSGGEFLGGVMEFQVFPSSQTLSPDFHG